jgi:LmbE family N-acetylglucosaminyl deacetylase
MSLRLLCVCAHPDDECFAFGGALALAAARGAETTVICLTDGQAATNRGTAASGKDLGKMRRAEFEASCKVLGVKSAEVWDYDDAKLREASFLQLAEKLVTKMRALRPHVVITFGSDGGLNTHPDHTMVSLATTAAFHWSGSTKIFGESGTLWQPQRLFLLTGNFLLPERQAPLLAPWTLTLDISSVFEKKVEAFRQHVSQKPLMEMAVPLFEKHGKEERYALAACAVPQPARQSVDLFEGVADVE